MGNMGSPVLFLDEDGRIAGLNTWAETFFGHRSEVLLGEDFVDTLIYEPARERIREILFFIAGAKTWKGLTPLFRKGEKATSYYSSFSALEGPATAEAAYMVVVLDFNFSDEEGGLSHRIRTMLERSEELSQTGSWTWDRHTNFAHWSDQMMRIFGLEPGDAVPFKKEFRSRIHPDDLSAYLEARESGSEAGEYSARFRFYRFGDNELRYFAVSAQIIKDAEGEEVEHFGHCQDITPMIEQQEALEEANRRAALAEDFSNTGSYEWNLKTDKVYWSPQVYRIYGLDPDRDPVRSVEDIVPLIHPEDLSRWREEMKASIKAGSTHQMELRICRPNGEIVWIQTRGNYVQDEEGKPERLIGMVRNITRAKAAEMQLVQERERLGLAIEGSGAGVWDFFPANAHSGEPLAGDLIIDQALRNEFGIEEVEPVEVHRIMIDRIHPQDMEVLEEELQRAVANPGERIEVTFRARNVAENWRFIRIIGLASQLDGASEVRITGLWWDVTEERNRQERLQEEQRLQALGTLAGGVAHDFNNILQGILGASEVGSRRSDNEKVKAAFSDIQQSCDRAARVVRQILAFSRKMNSQFEALDFGDLFRETLPLIRAILPKNVDLDYEVRPGLPRIRGDRSYLQQVLLNLVTNGMKAMEPDGGWLKISLIQQDDPELEAGVLLSVTDTGIGIAKEDRAHIFEPYFSRFERVDGAGLGLATVDGIVKVHKGRITVESEPGEGSTFRLFIPALSAMEANPAVGTENGSGGSAGENPSRRILILDDEAILIRPLQAALEDNGYRVSSAQHPMEAMELLNGGDESFDLLISDLTMAQMTDLQLTRQLREKGMKIPVLVLSNEDAAVSGADLDELRPIAFEAKPFRFETLEKRIDDLIRA